MARLEEALTVDFSGGAYDSVAPTRFPRNAAAVILNGRIEPDGTVRRRPGTVRTHATALEADIGYGGTDFTTAAGVHIMIAIVGDKAFKSTDEGVTWSAAIATGLREDYYTFATMRVGPTVYLFAANGDTTVKRYDGTTWDTVPNAPSGVKFIAVFNGRLWYAGHSGVIIQGTKIADPTVVATPDGLLVQAITHSGDAIAGLFQIGPHLLVFDEDATAYIDGYGEQTIIVAVGATGFSRSVGCMAFRSITAIGDNGACWLSKRGVEYYSPNNGIVLLTKAVRGFMASIDWAQLGAHPGRPSAVYDDVDQNYFLSLSTTGLRNNRTLVLNLRQNAQDQRPGQTSAAAIDQQLSEDGTVLFGTDPLDPDYLSDIPAGAQLRSDLDGYMTLAGLSEGGDATGEDADGYLTTFVDDTLPATLFMAFVSSTTERSRAVHSLGYDGFFRRHLGVDKDDQLADGTGGVDVTMTVRSKPFVMQQPRRRKRVRIVHVASLQDAPATLSVIVRAGTKVTGTKTLTMPAAVDQAARTTTGVQIDGDTPEVEIQTSDAARLSLVGISAEILREY